MVKRKTISVKDMMGEKVTFQFPAERIISLVPSQSELIWELGLQNQLVGITKFCIHPKEMFSKVERVGGTKKVNLDKVIQLQPDLIIGNKEENEKSDILNLKKYFPVWMSDIKNVWDAYQMIEEIGRIATRKVGAKKMVKQIKREELKFRTEKADKNLIACAYFIWNNPYMVCGKNNFINTMLLGCGFKNVFAMKKYSRGHFQNHNTRYPEISEAQLKLANPKLILLSSEPFPFKEKHIQEIKLICPDAVVKIVDGEMFSWYGSRLKYSFQYFKRLLNDPEIIQLHDKS